jgi:hypothetical protein
MTDHNEMFCASCDEPIHSSRYGIPSWDADCDWEWCESALGPERLCLECVEKLHE